MKKPLVSIVIPIYNVEKYLDHCLESVRNQTYENIEVLMINDGSPDNSEEIALEFEKKDCRFKYYPKENGGLSSARNYGIEKCNGEYISFIDSDDWVEYDFIERLVNSIEINEADIAICNMKYIYSDGTERVKVPMISEEKTVSNMEGLRDLFNSKYYRNHAVNKLYRNNLFTKCGIRYPLNKLYEDVFTTYKLFYETNRISYVPAKLYDYLQVRSGSILNSGFSNKQLDIFEALDNILDFLTTNNIYQLLEKDYAHLVVSNIVSISNFIYPEYKKMNRNDRQRIKGILKGSYNRYKLNGFIYNRTISNEEKIRYIFIMHFFGMYSFFMRVIRK